MRLVLALAISASVCAAATYYVSSPNALPPGSDSNPGTLRAPWATLQHAADSAQPGDTVNVNPGHYTGFDITHGGTASAQVTFHALPGAVIDTPKDYGRGNLRGINGSNVSYYTIEGFTIIPAAGTARWYAAIRTSGSRGNWAMGIKVLDNVVEMRSMDGLGLFSSWTDGLLTQGNDVSGPAWDALIYVSNSARNYITRKNRVHDGGHGTMALHNNGDISMGPPGLNSNAVIEDNIIYNCGTAISMDGVQSSVIRNNLVYNTYGRGIVLYKIDGADGSKYNRVYNNTFINAPDGPKAPMKIDKASTDNTIQNNIFYTASPRTSGIWAEFETAANTVSDHNIVTGKVSSPGGATLTTAGWQSSGHDTHSIVVTDLANLFVNFTVNDFHLKAGSPAIKAGMAISSVTDDLEGKRRPQGGAYDIGAYAH